jgi:CcmD family protein
MKLLFVLLFPMFLMAQAYPDKIIMLDGHDYQAEVLHVIGDSIVVKQVDKRKGTTSLQAIDSLEINALGLVYTKNEGFLISRKAVEGFVASRYERAVMRQEKTNNIYIVLGIILIVWAGIFGYLLSLQGKISQLKKQLDERLAD